MVVNLTFTLLLKNGLGDWLDDVTDILKDKFK
jgi:hypothetical protein